MAFDWLVLKAALLMPMFQFLFDNAQQLLQQMIVHLGLTATSLAIAVLIGLPLGIFISRKQRFASPVLAATGMLQTIPSIALLGFMIPLFGIGVGPAIIALFLYALLPIVRNTFTGISGVDNAVVDAAKGMGMTAKQILLKVQLPLAMPVILAGIRTATVINVGVATLAAYIGAGGLGEFIFGGIALNNSEMIIAGAVPAALLAIVLDGLLAYFQKADIRKSVKFFSVFVPILLVGFVLQSSGIFVKSGIKAAFSPEFIGRNDGLPGIEKQYGFKIPYLIIAPALVYKAMNEGYVDVIDGYTTDSRIKAYKFKILEDDLKTMPAYFAAPLIRQDALSSYPDLQAVMNLLSGKITDSTILALNYQVDFDQISPKHAATAFLKSTDLYRNSVVDKGLAPIKIGSKIFTEQYILVEIYKQLIEGHLQIPVEAITGLGGTKICFEALINGEIDLYPEYTGTGLEVLLSDKKKPASLAANEKSTLTYLRKNMESSWDITWLEPLGFNNSYALMVNANDPTYKHINNISQLADHILQ